MNLVCIHGNSLDASIFDSIHVSGFNKISITLPGHGKKDIGHTSSFQEMVDSVFDEIKNLENVILLGSSLGGHIAHHLLAKMNPLGVISISSPPLNLENVSKAFLPHPHSHHLFTANVSENDALALADSMLTFKKDLVGKLSSLILNTNPMIRDVIGKSLMKGEFLDEIDLLTKFSGTKILIVPTFDSIVNKDYIRSLKMAEVVDIEGNHILTWDNPEGVNEFLGRELSKLRR